MKSLCISVLISLFTFLPSVDAWAKAVIGIEMSAEKEVIINNVTKRVAADTVNPGETIFYTLHYVNTGDEPATNVVIVDPIPNGSVYVAGSAWGNEMEITFSIDGGKTFKKASLLTFEVKLPGGKTEIRNVSPEKYTHIRWVIKQVPAKGSGVAGFRVLVK